MKRPGRRLLLPRPPGHRAPGFRRIRTCARLLPCRRRRLQLFAHQTRGIRAMDWTMPADSTSSSSFGRAASTTAQRRRRRISSRSRSDEHAICSSRTAWTIVANESSQRLRLSSARSTPSWRRGCVSGSASISRCRRYCNPRRYLCRAGNATALQASWPVPATGRSRYVSGATACPCLSCRSAKPGCGSATAWAAR